MVRQYIGARYVPKFYENSAGTSEWRSGVIYEPLTIVTWNGNSYTSKNTVPAEIGDPSANPTYWVATGIFNQQVESLREDLETLSGVVDANTQQIGNMEPRLSRIDDRKVIFIGDSFCDGNVGGSGLSHGIYSVFTARASLTDGVNAKLYSKGGAGFIANAQGKTFMDLAMDAVADGSLDPDEVSEIIIATAGNDGGQSMGDINAAKSAVFDYLHANYPYAIIYIAVVGGSTDGTTRNQICNVVQTACYYAPPHYVQPIYNAMLPMWFFNAFSSDGIHPNLNGCTQIGYLLARAFLERTSRPRLLEFNYNATLNSISGEVTSGAQFYISPANDELRITCTQTPSIAVPVNVTYNQGCAVKLGKVTNGMAFLVPNATALNGNILKHIPADMYVYKTSNQWVHIFGEIVIVKDTASEAVVYFKATTSPENIESSTIRMGYSIATLTPTGYI